MSKFTTTRRIHIDPYADIKNKIRNLNLPTAIRRDWDEINDISDETFVSDTGSFGKISRVRIHGSDYIMKELFYKQMFEEGLTDEVLNEIVHQSVVSGGNYICPLRGVIVGDSSVMMIMDECGKPYRVGGGVAAVQKHLKHFGELCRAIQYLHDRHILHLDIKPDNVMVASNGEVRLIDFGQSMFTEHIVHKSVGTLDYQAPEVLYNKDENYHVSSAVDMWELGATLYEMITGKKPFGVGRLEDIENRIRNADWDKETLRNYNEKAYEICLHLLEKDPRKRWSVRRVLKYLAANGSYGVSRRHTSHLNRSFQVHTMRRTTNPHTRRRNSSV